MFTNDELMRIAMEGTEPERHLALSVIESRSEKNAVSRRLIDALHKIEELEKQVAGEVVVESAPARTLIFDKYFHFIPVCNCGKPYWGIIPPPCPVHGSPVHGSPGQLKIWC